MFTDLTEQYVVIGRVCFVDFLTRLGGSKEIATFAVKLGLLSVVDIELLWTVQVLDISRIVDLVRDLVVNENAVSSFTCEEVFEDLGKLR